MFWNKIKVFSVSNSVELNLICSLRPFLHSTIRGIPRSPKQALPSPPHGWRGRGSGGPAPAQSRRTRSRRPPAWVPEPEPSPGRAEDPKPRRPLGSSSRRLPLLFCPLALATAGLLGGPFGQQRGLQRAPVLGGWRGLRA